MKLSLKTETNGRRASSRLARAAAGALSLVLAGVLASACSAGSRGGFGDEPKPVDPDLDVAEAGVPEGGASKCVSEEVKGEPVPLSMIVLLDRSGSMQGDQWTSATNAIRAFADRAEVVGMKMGLQFFPPLTGGDQCNAATYANLAVPIAPLPDNVIPIQQRLANTSPSGGTPMRSGLEGSINAMTTWLAENDPHAAAIILVTDGDPSGCGNIDAVASVASSGAQGTPPVKTFAVGMQGATFSNLDKVAQAGDGAPKAFNVGGGAAAQQALLDALDTIRTGALSCEYVLPIPRPEDGILDLDSVDIKFTPGENDPVETIRRVTNKGACGETTGGFYYDDNDDPERIVLCPASCGSVRGASAEAKVDVVLGCIQRPN